MGARLPGPLSRTALADGRVTSPPVLAEDGGPAGVDSLRMAVLGALVTMLLEGHMRDLIRTNNHALVSAIEALLTEAHIRYHVLDREINSLDGNILAFPLRIAVADEDQARARTLLSDAGLA